MVVYVFYSISNHYLFNIYFLFNYILHKHAVIVATQLTTRRVRWGYSPRKQFRDTMYIIVIHASTLFIYDYRYVVCRYSDTFI